LSQDSIFWNRGLWLSFAAVGAAAVLTVAFSIGLIDGRMLLLLLASFTFLLVVSVKYGALGIVVLLVGFPEMQIPFIQFDVPMLLPIILFIFSIETLYKGRWNTAKTGGLFVIFVATMAISWLWAESAGLLSQSQLNAYSTTNIHLSRIRVVWQIGAWVLGFGIFLYTVNHIKTLADIYVLAKYLMIIGLIVAAYSYYELVALEIGLPYTYPSIHDIDFVPNAKISYSGTLFPRVYGSFDEPKLLGRFLLIPLFLSASAWSVLNTRRYLFYSVFLLGALALTFSTTAFLGVVVGFFAWVYLLQRPGRRQVWRITAGAAVTISILAVVSGLFIDNFFAAAVAFVTLHPARVVGLIGNTHLVSSDYVNGWILGWKLFTISPILGVGIGNSPFYSVSTDNVVTPFNLLLLLLGEIGILGLAAFCGLIGTILFRTFRAIRLPHTIADQPLATALIAGAIASFIGGFITYLAFGGARFYFEDWVLLGMMARFAQLISRTSASGENN